jgi:hypothetical protein
VNATKPPQEGQFVDDEPPPRVPAPPTKRELDPVFENARAVAEPVIEMVYLGAALWSTAKLAWERAKRKAAKRAREQQR